MKQRALIIQVPSTVLSGETVPDLKLPGGATIFVEGPGLYQVYWGEHMITMRQIATESGEPVYAVGALEGAFEDLVARVGATRVGKLNELWKNSTIKARLIGYGEFKEEEGFPVAPHMWSGGDALAMGSDYEYVPTEEEPE